MPFHRRAVLAGTTGSQVRINFRNELGDLDLALFDSAGNLLRNSAGAGNSESISLAGLASGTYFVQVQGFNGALNPAYSLTVDPPRQLLSDLFELNQTRPTAATLGTILGTQSWNNLSIHDNLDQDWFQFSTAAVGGAGHAVRIDFLNSQGDLDLNLFDSAGNLLGSSATGNDSEQVSLQGRAAGTYYVQVIGFNGAVQSSYQLGISTPVGMLSPDRLEGTAGNNSRTAATQVKDQQAANLSGGQTLLDLNLHSSTDQDWFRFTTVGKGGLANNVVLNFDQGSGSQVLKLYNASGTLLSTGTGSNGTLVASLNGRAAGTYYAQVSGAANSYSLTFDTPSANQADWTFLVYMTADTLVDQAFADINELEQVASLLPASVNIAVLWDQSAGLKTFATGNGSQAAWGTTGRAFITPDTNPNQVATKFELLTEQNTGNPTTLGNFVQWATAAAPAGQYGLVLWDHGAGLRGLNFDKSDGTVEDHLTANELVTALTGRPHMDLLAFDACFMGVAENAYKLKGLTDVVVASQDIMPGNGLPYDQILSILANDPGGVSADALATRMVQAFASRYGADVTLSAVRTAELDDLATVLQTFGEAVENASFNELQILNTLASGALVYSQTTFDQRDLGSFLLGVASNASLSTDLRNAANDVRDQLTATVLAKTGDTRGSSGLSIYLPVDDPTNAPNVNPASFYALEFSDFALETGWLAALNSLKDNSGSRPDPVDVYDRSLPRNDLKSSASDLRRLVGPATVTGLNLDNANDQDWFRFQIEASAGSMLQIQADVVGTGGTLTVQLRDDSGTVILQEETTTTSALLTLNGLSAGQHSCYLRFFSGVGSVLDYQFTIEAPATTGSDWAGANSSMPKAYTLLFQSGSTFPGLSLEGNGQDWFRFTTSKLASAELQQLTVSVAGADPLEAQLRDASGTVVSVARGTGALVLPYTNYGTAETYTVVLVNPGANAIPYSLQFEPAASTADANYVRDQFAVGTSLGANWSATGSFQVQGGQVQITGALGATGRALRGDFSSSDTGVQVKFQLPATGNVKAAVLARANLNGSKLTTYEARIVRTNNVLTAQLYRTVNDVSTLLRSVPVSRLTTGTLGLEVQGQRLRLLLNGRSLIDHVDTVMLPAGQAGFLGTSGVVFDDFQAVKISSALPVTLGPTGPALGAGWQVSTGKFTVQDQQIAAASTSAAAFYVPASVADVAVEAVYVLQPGQSVSLLARHRGTAAAATDYQARLTTSSTGVVTASLVRVQNQAITAGTKLASLAGIPTAGTLRFEVQGNLLRLYVDGTLRVQAIDSSLRLPGQTGIATQGLVTLNGLNARLLAPLPTGSTAFTDGFDRSDSTQLGASWLERTGDLGIQGGNLVGQTAAQNIALWQEASLLDFTLSARVNLTAAGQTASLLGRYTEPLTYYEARLRRDADGLATAFLFRVNNGVATQLPGSVRTTAQGLLSFEMAGNTLRLRMDGGLLLTAINTSLAGPGLVGVALSANAALDNFDAVVG